MKRLVTHVTNQHHFILVEVSLLLIDQIDSFSLGEMLEFLNQCEDLWSNLSLCDLGIGLRLFVNFRTTSAIHLP